MPARASCVGSDHRPPATGGSCACGMVTKILSARPVRTGPQHLVPPEVRDALARCLHEAPGDSSSADAAASRPDDVQLSEALRRRADRLIAALAAAGFVVTVDGALRQAA